MTLLVTESRQNLPAGRVLVQVVCTSGCGTLHVTTSDDHKLGFVLRRLSKMHDRMVHEVVSCAGALCAGCSAPRPECAAVT